MARTPQTITIDVVTIVSTSTIERCRLVGPIARALGRIVNRNPENWDQEAIAELRAALRLLGEDVRE